jgi:hypothetical protein
MPGGAALSRIHGNEALADGVRFFAQESSDWVASPEESNRCATPTRPNFIFGIRQ